MSEQEGNGNYVTWRELNLTLAPMRSDISEIKGDVKELLATRAGQAAVSSWQRFFFGTITLGVLLVIAGVVTTLVHA